jgi:putative DNA primase/helicase
MVRIDDNIEASRVTWECALEGTAREILGEVETVESRSNDGHRNLQDFLVQTLEEAGGHELSATLQVLVQNAGFSWHTAKRVKAAAGIISQKDGKDGPWIWKLR